MSGTRLRAVSIAFVVAAAIALVAIPVYAFLATSQFALRSVWNVGALVPLLRASSFGRGYVDLELTFALFVLAALVALWVDRPERPHRSIAELLAFGGALLAAGAVLLVPGISGHAAQTSPRAWSILFDWSHLSAGSIWVGGLIGLLVLWSSLPRGAAHRRARRLRAALLERRVRVGQRADRLGRRGGDRPPADDRRRCGRRRTARRSSGRSGCCSSRC